MSLAEYYDKSAVAASQVVAGFDPDVFRDALSETAVGISFGQDAASSHEGRAALDLTVRLLARLYPGLCIRATGSEADSLAADLVELAEAINPRIDMVPDASVGIAVGAKVASFDRTVYAGSDGWTGQVSMASEMQVGRSRVPFGGGAAACLAASALFRLQLDTTSPPPLDATLCCGDGVTPAAIGDPPEDGWVLPQRTALVGCGAIGEAAAWALGRSPLGGTLHVIDPETVDLGNLQRYVLTAQSDVGQPKATLAAGHITGAAHGLLGQPHDTDWVGALEHVGHEWNSVLAAVDTASARRAIQAALPGWVANAWTQPGDLGVSDHNFLIGACLACLYLPAGTAPNEDQLVADALGIPDLVVNVRTLLHTGAPPPPPMLATIATRLGVELAALDPFETRSIRDLYVEGVCGGAVLPLRSNGATPAGVHVPLAHQSALAGVLLAARLTRRAAGVIVSGTEVTRLDVTRDSPDQPTQLALKDPRGICLCQDRDFLSAYHVLWGP